MPPAGAKKVKTTKELLAQIQSRAAPRSPRSPASPASPASPDVLLIEPDEPCPVKPESPLRNGGASPRWPAAPAAPAPRAPPSPPPPPAPPLEDPREVRDCTCGEEAAADCAAAWRSAVLPLHVQALHHALLPGVNGTRAPLHPHQFAVRKLADPERPELFASVVPLYNYSDYADDYCVKNMSRVPLCAHLPWTEFAPAPPDPPPAPEPPPPRPYPVDEVEVEVEREAEDMEVEAEAKEEAPEAPEPVAPEPSERLKAPLEPEDETFKVIKCESVCEVPDEFKSEQREHRTVEKTKPSLDGAQLYALCRDASRSIECSYAQTFAAPTVTLPEAGAEVGPALEAALQRAEAETARDPRGRPTRLGSFAEWHECARLGELIALPYVVID